MRPTQTPSGGWLGSENVQFSSAAAAACQVLWGHCSGCELRRPPRCRLIRRCGRNGLKYWAAQQAGGAPTQASKQRLYRAAVQAGFGAVHAPCVESGCLKLFAPRPRHRLCTCPATPTQRVQNALLELCAPHAGVDQAALKRLFDEVPAWAAPV